MCGSFPRGARWNFESEKWHLWVQASWFTGSGRMELGLMTEGVTVILGILEQGGWQRHSASTGLPKRSVPL